jgi:hypothetical protein
MVLIESAFGSPSISHTGDLRESAVECGEISVFGGMMGRAWEVAGEFWSAILPEVCGEDADEAAVQCGALRANAK